MSGALRAGVTTCARFVSAHSQRHLSASSVAMQQVSDPIQKLYLDKIKEYRASAQSGKMPGMTPKVEKQYKEELDRVANQYGAHKEDFTKFPVFQWTDAPLEKVTVEPKA